MSEFISLERSKFCIEDFKELSKSPTKLPKQMDFSIRKDPCLLTQPLNSIPDDHIRHAKASHCDLYGRFFADYAARHWHWHCIN